MAAVNASVIGQEGLSRTFPLLKIGLQSQSWHAYRTFGLCILLCFRTEVLIMCFFLVVAFRAAISAQARRAFVSSIAHAYPFNSRDHSISLRDSASAFRPVDRPRPAAYVDRDESAVRKRASRLLDFEPQPTSITGEGQDHLMCPGNTTTQDLTQHAASMPRLKLLKYRGKT